MSTRSIFEFNHDMAHERLAWWGHHSYERKVVTKYDEVKL